MKIRTPFAAAFAILALGAAYLGFQADANPTPVNDKALHFIVFFALTLTAYWVVETTRRILMKIVPVGAAVAGVVSEFAQNFLNPARAFDPLDIAANVLGSFAAIALCSWYHKRMLDRKRRRKMAGYGLVTTDDVADIELGEGPGAGGVGEDGELMPPPEGDEDDDDGAAWDNMDDGDGADDAAAKDNAATENGALTDK